MNKMVKLILGLSLVLCLLLGATALATTPTETVGESKIEFEPGVLEPVKPEPGEQDDFGGYEFSLNFGLRKVPSRREVYYADGYGSDYPVGGGEQASGISTFSPIAVTVSDGRSQNDASAWRYSVKMTPFTTTSSSQNFNASLYLLNGVKNSNRGTTVTNTHLTLASNMTGANAYATLVKGILPTYKGTTNVTSGILIQTNNTNVPVLSCAKAAGIGQYTAQWALSNVRMQLGADFGSITDADYVSTMTWTLEPV